MARLFLTPIDLGHLELLNAAMHNSAGAPGVGVPGQVYYDTTGGFTKVWDGTTWVDSRARSTHSGTQLANTISDLETTVKAYPLNTFAIPVATVSFNSQRLSNLGTPTAASDAVTKSYLDNLITTNNSGLSNEIARAEAAEATLTNNLASEVTRAQAAEGTLTTNLANEKTRAQAAEGTLTTNLASEVTRAQGAESSLSTSLGSEATRALAAEATLTANLASEVSRATNADATLTANLAAEVTRATNAEGTLTANLATEVSRAQAAEATLTTSLQGEITRAQAAEGTLGTYLMAEATRAQAAEATLTGHLNVEVARALAAEATLTTNLASEVTRAEAAEATLTSGLSTEVSRATAAEATLRTNLSNAAARDLSDIATANPTKADVDLHGYKLLHVNTPTIGSDGANKSYVDSQVQLSAAGIASKQPVEVVLTDGQNNLTGTQTVDGHALAVGSRVLVAIAPNDARNGVYEVQTGAWTRSTVPGELEDGAMWLVQFGSVNRGTQWRNATDTASNFTVDNTPVEIVQFSAALALQAGAGLSLDGNLFDIVSTNAAISVSADSIAFVPDTTKSLDVGPSGAFVKVNSTGALGHTASGLTVNAGDGIAVGSTLSAVTKPSGGLAVDQAGLYVAAYDGLVSTSTGLHVDSSVVRVGNGLPAVARLFASTLPNAASTTLNHQLNTLDVVAQVRATADGSVIECDILVSDTNHVTISFATAPPAGAYRAVIMGAVGF